MANKIAYAVALAALIAAPAFAQTTVTTQSAPPPPSTTTTTVQTQPATPPSSTTTVQTQPAQTQPGTQVVVVNPAEPTTTTAPATRVRVRADPDVTTVETRPSVSPLQIIAMDALYGGLAGVAIGGGVALINQGNNWQRDLSLGAGIGVLAGGIFGGFDAFSRSNNNTTHAAADPGHSSNTGGSALAMRGRF